MTDWRESLLALSLVVGAWIALMSEGVGAFHVLNRTTLALGWGLFVIVGAVLGWRHRRSIIARLPSSWEWQGWASFWVLTTIAFAAVSLVVAIVAPPNTNDSLQYHMSRVAHWASQHSLDHFPTPIERQLWMPPFAEIAMLNLYVLAAGDRLVNLVQWTSMVVSVLGVALLASRLGAGRAGQAMAGLFAATLPMGILQSTSTQTDYVTALWVICLASIALKAHREQLQIRDWVAAGLAAGLGALTKGTFYGFALPFLLWLGVSTIRRSGWRSAIRYGLLGIALVAVLNAGAWRRNLLAYGLPLGPSGVLATHGNEIWNWKVVVSNAVRSLTLQIATPYGDVNGPIADAVTAVHRAIGLDINDPRTTMGEYRVKRSFHEDYAGNPLHTLLVPVSLVLLAWPGKRQVGAARSSGVDKAAWVYAGVVGLSVLVFFTLYKWQATGSRLQLSLFVAWSPVAGLALERLRFVVPRSRVGALTALAVGWVLGGAGLRYLLMNPSRPLLPRPGDGISLWNTSRTALLFINTPESMGGYPPLIQAATGLDCPSIGLKIDSSDPEYPFWALIAPPDSGIRLEHVDVTVPHGGIPALGNQCAILCTYCTDTVLDGMPLLFNIEGRYSLYRRAQ